jgi:ATP-dependent Clp protease, protease subunit
MNSQIIESAKENLVVLDVKSKLSQNRILFIDNDITDELASDIICQLLYLDSVNHDRISVYINTCGGYCTAGLAVYDISKLIKSKIDTYCIGKAYSMGAVLMMMGENRYITKNSSIMIHKVAGGGYGDEGDLKITYESMKETEESLLKIFQEKFTLGSFPDRDMYLNADKSLKLGIVTKIL